MPTPPPSHFEWVIGLHAYTQSPPPNKAFARFYAVTCNMAARFGVALTHFGAEGSGYSGKFVNSSSPTAKHLVASRFSDITSLSCVVNAEGSDAPAFDRIVSASFGWTPLGELLLCVGVNEGLSAFLSQSFESTLSTLLDTEDWCFGYCLRDSVARRPRFQVLSIGTDTFTEEELQLIQQWDDSMFSERTRRPRSVYPITILNETQLNCRVNGGTLEQFIQRTTGTTLTRVGKLSVWRVPELQVQRLRDTLGTAGALIAYVPPTPGSPTSTPR